MRYPLTSSLAIAIALATPVAHGADGDLVDATDPARIAALMQDEGYRAKLGVDNEGDPKIESSAAGKDFAVFFYGCDKGRNCKSIQFNSGFDLEEGIAAPRISRWNRENRFGRAWIDDESDPFLELDYNLAGGVSKANFIDTLDWWSVVLGEFKEYVGWR